jgi:hypothetical protein
VEAIVITVPVRSALSLDEARTLWHQLGEQLRAADAIEAVTADA